MSIATLQRDLLLGLAAGKTNTQIGLDLGVSRSTVEKCLKLSVYSVYASDNTPANCKRAEAVANAFRCGFIT